MDSASLKREIKQEDKEEEEKLQTSDLKSTKKQAKAETCAVPPTEEEI